MPWFLFQIISELVVVKMRFYSWNLVLYRVLFLQCSVYYCLVRDFIGSFQQLYFLLYYLGGQQFSIFFIVPPNFYYSWDGLQNSKRGSILDQSKKLIFLTVYSSRKFLAIPQKKDMLVGIWTTQQTNILDRQVFDRKPIGFFIELTKDMRPVQPTSIMDTQFYTCPGIKQFFITYQKKKVMVSIISSYFKSNFTIFSTSKMSIGRQWLSRPPMQKMPVLYVDEQVRVFPACNWSM